jgi:hypothetical protein
MKEILVTTNKFELKWETNIKARSNHLKKITKFVYEAENMNKSLKDRGQGMCLCEA